MRNHKGFTLVEVLAVIVVLGLLAAIITPVVNKLLKSNEEALSQNQIDNIITIAKKYAVEHSEILPAEGSNDIYELEIDDLIFAGYIDKDNIVDPNTKEKIDGHVNIYYDNNYNQYQYEFVTDTYLLAGTEYPFSYVTESDNKEQTFIVPKTGYYKLEVWGAQGGNASSTYKGGYGGYSSGFVRFVKGETIYINVGGAGSSSNVSNLTGGYNGGGSTVEPRSETYEGAGGGATHIALSTGTLSSFDADADGVADSSEIEDILIVAGGGGGGSYYTGGQYSGTGGSGGGAFGVTGTKDRNDMSYGTGGTQGAGGTNSGLTGLNGKYGQGGSNSSYSTYGCAGGGGGFYGGGASFHSGAGGGSGYIGNSRIIDGVMYCYGCGQNNYYLTKTISTTGSKKDSVSCPDGYSDDPVSRCAKSGNGYAKVTYVGKSVDIENDSTIVYDFINSDDLIFHTFTASETGYYKFETWGAQGQNSNAGISGGKGGYASGILYLNQNTTLYVYAGGQNGYNGGGSKGDSGSNGGVGGGATDIRVLPKSDADSLASRIMVAGGGGGAYNWYGDAYNKTGGAGGGLTGSAGGYYNTCQSTGGTQVAGGTCSSSVSVTGSFGKGGNGTNAGAGGGGGYYGGSGRYDNPGSGSGAGGGSSYVSGYTGCIAVAGANSITARSVDNSVCKVGTTVPECSHHYLGYIFLSPVIIDGNSSMPSKNGSGNVVGNSGNGAVIITYLGATLN